MPSRHEVATEINAAAFKLADAIGTPSKQFPESIEVKIAGVLIDVSRYGVSIWPLTNERFPNGEPIYGNKVFSTFPEGPGSGRLGTFKRGPWVDALLSTSRKVIDRAQSERNLRDAMLGTLKLFNRRSAAH